MTMNARMPALILLTLTLAACGGGGGTPEPIGTPVTNLADSGAGSLRDTLAAAKSGDTLRLTGTGTLTLASPLSIDRDVTIIATGVTSDAAGKGRALNVAKGATVTMQGGTITGGTGGTVDPAIFTLAPAATTAGTWGGNLINSGTLTLDGVTIQNGQAFNGGGIFNVPGATLTLKNVTMTSNRATIPTPDLENESTGSGGAIANDGTLTIDGGTFKNNSAVYTGGVIRHTTGTLTIKGGTFDSNTCTYTQGACGGGVLAAFDGQTTITGGTFTKNATNASGGGGVILLGGASTVTITGGTFSGNTAANGGVINTSRGGTLNVGGGTFEGNTVTRYGGALALVSSTKGFTMTGGTVENNRTTGTVDNGGGGLWLNARSTISGGTIRGNSSMYGGGIDTWRDLTLTGGTIEKNTATDSGGGIIFIRPGRTYRIGGTAQISGNTATGSGGGVTIVQNAQVTMDGGSISGNSVTGSADGGGVRVLTGTVFTLAGGEIKGNTAVKTGGGITVDGTVNMTGGSITGNTVTSRTEGQGGGVETNGAFQTSPTSAFVLSGATVSGNRADGRDGGGFWNDGKLTIQSGSVSGNSARNGGGVFNTRVGVYAQPGGSVTGNNPDNVFNSQ